MSQPDIRRKAFAYITHQQRLLVFEHPDSPEAGIQVPAGSIEPGETPQAGTLRLSVYLRKLQTDFKLSFNWRYRG